MQAYTQVCAINAANFKAQGARGLLLTQLDRNEEAVEAFQAALEVEVRTQPEAPKPNKTLSQFRFVIVLGLLLLFVRAAAQGH